MTGCVGQLPVTIMIKFLSYILFEIMGLTSLDRCGCKLFKSLKVFSLKLLYSTLYLCCAMLVLLKVKEDIMQPFLLKAPGARYSLPIHHKREGYTCSKGNLFGLL